MIISLTVHAPRPDMQPGVDGGPHMFINTGGKRPALRTWHCQAQRGPQEEKRRTRGCSAGHPGLEGVMTGEWPPSSPATEGELWTERSSPGSHVPVPAGHCAPRHSHSRRLPRGPPDTPTADATHHPWGPPDTPRADASPTPGPPDTPTADVTPPPSGGPQILPE